MKVNGICAPSLFTEHYTRQAKLIAEYKRKGLEVKLDTSNDDLWYIIEKATDKVIGVYNKEIMFN